MKYRLLVFGGIPHKKFGKKVFVMDRGSNKPLDVKGITKAELTDRFGAGHGMIVVGGKVLDIFNDSISACTPALKKLGLWDNPNILFNIEYVAGSTNVLSYNKNFLAVHGLLEIEQVTPTKRATKEKPANKAAMQDLLNNLAPVANKNGYEVLGSIPTTLKGNPDLSGELNKKYTVSRTAAEKETKTLSQWLAKAKVPYISLLTDPTTGGVTASFAMLGDLNIAEPGALIGFAGPRVVKETIGKDLPEGFQTSEFVLEKGFLDLIVKRNDLKNKLTELLLMFKN
jgi:hypothetical protein